MIDGITVKILGDFGPFSRMGKSIGYQITIGDSDYLIDCGSPLFQQIGGHGLKKIKGLVITHCHDDHKRWFSDLALFNMYTPNFGDKIKFLSTEDINTELIKASGPALDRSLSSDSKTVTDIPYEEYVDQSVIGPLARYRIVSRDEGKGITSFHIEDRNGSEVGPDVAKIVINRMTGRPRMLFRDPYYKEWVEPESFYPFSSSVFYEEDRNIYCDEGFTIEAIKSPVWHGITNIGVKIKTAGETLIFSSDTVNNKKLWLELYAEKKVRVLNMNEKEFESASVIYGDINNYIERTWSEERYMDALKAFNEAVVIHDISCRNSVVHTDYEKLQESTLNKEKVILTHSPDRMTSEWVLSNTGKTFKIKGNEFYEIVGEKLCMMDADIYHKDTGKYFVGYKSNEGKYSVYEKNGLLGISPNGWDAKDGSLLYKVELYEDISGKYFPKLENKDSIYFERKDRRVELIEFSEKGSSGKIVEDQRGKIRGK
jgi:ribonuclease BN (tRNA processing enzyme)